MAINLTPKTKEFLEKVAPRDSYWRNKNKYYYSYVADFISFIVPKSKKLLEITDPIKDIDGVTGEFDYIVLSDVLGYIADIDDYLSNLNKNCRHNGRLVITQYSALWEPILRLASIFRLRRPTMEQNWLSINDLTNFLNLAGFETIRSGSKMLMPKYIPIISFFFNKIVANIFPFTKLGLFHYVIARPRKNIDIDQPTVSYVVPARNEAGTVEIIARELPNLGRKTEIIFVEGGSSDNTYEEIERVSKMEFDGKQIIYAKQLGKGKGDAVRKGFELAHGDILFIYDADMTVPPLEMKKFYKAICSNTGEFINGSRLVYPMEKESMRILNIIANKFFGFAFSAILGQNFKDTLCGTKVLWRKDYEDIKNNRSFFGDFDPFGDFDLIFGAAKLNRKIIDVPVHYQARVYGSTNISRFRHGWLLLKMTVFVMRKIRFI